MHRLPNSAGLVVAAAGLCIATACSDTPDARVPTAPMAPSAQVSMVPAHQTTVDSVARGIALAMASSDVRTRLLDDFRDSPFPAHALELSSYLNGTQGSVIARDAARALSMSQPAFLKLVAALPSMLVKMERPIDRVKWTATANVVVYGSAVNGLARVQNTPTTTGFTTNGSVVTVPLWTAGHAPFVLIMPSDVAFGKNPEHTRLAAPHLARATISTRDEEIRATMSPEALTLASNGQRQMQPMSMVPPCDPNQDPACSGGGGGGGYDTDGTRLSAQYTPGYCFAWSAWGAAPLDASNDRDSDGIRDDCEFAIAWAFRPMLARNNADDAPGKEPHWSVTRIPGSVTGVRIFYALSYYRDAGFPITHTQSHDGDSEFIIVDVQNDMNPYDYTLWEVNDATLSAHWQSSVDQTMTWGAGSLEYPEVYRGRPRIWASWDKHANYNTKDNCQSSWTDTCDSITTGTVYDDLEVRSDANLGNYYDVPYPSASRQLMDCVSSWHPGTGGAAYGIECFWETFPDFAGWQGTTSGGAGAYGNSLSFYGF